MNDIYPRRNLGLAEHWGRKVENRVDGVVDEILKQRGSVDGLVRNSAFTSGDLATRIQGIAAAHASLPIPFSYNSTVSNFALPTAWTTRGQVAIQVPEGAATVDIFALGRVAATAPGTTESTTYFQWPFALSTVTSEYGMRVNPVSGVYTMHWGMDFSYGGISGDPIRAAGNGTVAAKGSDSDGRGNWIELSHNGAMGNLKTRYFHMQSPSSLSVGSSVTRNVTVLGLVGTTGNSTGPHLHWETEDESGTINPRTFMENYSESTTTPGPPPIYGRVVIEGNASMEVFSGYIGGLQLVHGRTIPVSAGQAINVETQIRSGVSRPADTGRASSLTVLGAFRP